MKRSISLILVICLSFLSVFSQEKTLKEKALDEFKSEHYDVAINLLEQALKQTTDDADIYYYLGWFNHYKIYDSRPLAGLDYVHSEQIFQYFDKALELNPNHGDAKYFYGAECSGNAFLAMQNYDSDKLKYFYSLAYKKGAYPNWLIEFGKNILNTCNKDAILFTAGNADFDICSYLQLCENYRTDITIISIGNLDRPWYVEFLKKGLTNCVKSVNINLTQQQIMDIHPFKWKETEISINVSLSDISKYGLPQDYKMRWSVLPDLQSERIHNKIEGEAAQKRTYLSPQRTILLQIVEDNLSQRTIYFTNFAEPTFYGGLNSYFQNCGLISRLTPIKTINSDFEFDKEKMENLLTSQNIVQYKDLKSNNIPRVSGVAMSGYGSTVLNLANIYEKSGDAESIQEIAKLYEENFKIGINPNYEGFISENLNKLQ